MLRERGMRRGGRRIVSLCEIYAWLVFFVIYGYGKWEMELVRHACMMVWMNG